MTRKRRKLLRLLITGLGIVLLLSALSGVVVASTSFNVADWLPSVLFIMAIYGTGFIVLGFYAFRGR